MGDGVSRSINLAGPLEAMRQSIQGIRDEVSRPLDIPVRVIGLDRARADLEDGTRAGAIGDGMSAPPGILPRDQDWSIRPKAKRYGATSAWDGPEDFEGAGPDRLGALASEGWDKISGGGAYHTLQEAGRFGRKWGSFLSDDKAKEQREWSDAAATPEGRTYMGSSEDAEKIGKRISVLMREIGQGGTGAIKAAEELKKAQIALEAVGKAGKDAAEGLGGEMGARLKAELEDTLKKGSAGEIEGGSGKGYFTPGRVMGMANNPSGAIQGLAMDGGLSLLGGLGAGALAAVGITAATVADLYVSYKYARGKEDDNATDNEESTNDWVTSRKLGNKFDFRNEYWDRSRTHSREGVDSDGARRVLGSIGIGLDTFQGDISGKMSPGGKGLTERMLRDRVVAGTSEEEWSSLFGASVRSGTVSASTTGYSQFSNAMLGYLSRMADSGVEGTAALHGLTSLAQQQVAALGHMSEGDQKFFTGMLGDMAATGDPAMKNRGAEMLSSMGAPKSGKSLAMVFGPIMNDPARQRQLIDEHYSPEDAARLMAMDPFSRMSEMNRNPAITAQLTGEAVNSQKFKGVPLGALGSLVQWNASPLNIAHHQDKIDTSEAAAARRSGEAGNWLNGPRFSGLLETEQWNSRWSAISIANAGDAKNTGWSTSTILRDMGTFFENWKMQMSSNTDSLRRTADALEIIARKGSSRN